MDNPPISSWILKPLDVWILDLVLDHYALVRGALDFRILDFELSSPGWNPRSASTPDFGFGSKTNPSLDFQAQLWILPENPERNAFQLDFWILGSWICPPRWAFWNPSRRPRNSGLWVILDLKEASAGAP